VDAAWMERVRAAAPGCSEGEAHVDASGEARVGGRCPRIVPRVAWEMPPAAVDGLDDKWVSAAVTLIAKVVQQHNFDGIVLDGPVTPALFALLRPLSTALHQLPATSLAAGRRVLIGVLPPAVRVDGEATSGVPPSLLQSLHGVVDRWSVMTYDYSAHRGGGGTGPNAPVRWASDVISQLAPDPAVRATLLLGVPWYGYDDNEAITGDRWRTMVTAGGVAEVAGSRPLLVNRKAAEHYMRYVPPTPHSDTGGRSAQQHTVYYPTPWMLAKRTATAVGLGCGIAVWELGQGLPCFPDALP